MFAALIKVVTKDVLQFAGKTFVSGFFLFELMVNHASVDERLSWK